MMASTPYSNTDLAAQLRRVRARWRRVTALRAAGTALLAAALALALAAGTERAIAISDGAA